MQRKYVFSIHSTSALPAQSLRRLAPGQEKAKETTKNEKAVLFVRPWCVCWAPADPTLQGFTPSSLGMPPHTCHSHPPR